LKEKNNKRFDDMTSTHLLELNLASYLQRNIYSRKYSQAICSIIPENKNDLIDLLFDAFSDYHTQNDQARLSLEQDLDNYFSGTVYLPMLNCSWGYWKDKTLIGACLLSYWKDRESPLLNCIAVKNVMRSRNVSPVLFQASIFSLIETGQSKVCATISENNSLPMHLAERIGFTAIE
jgi:hypothetical protein